MSPSVMGLDRSLVTISSNKGTEGSLRNKMLFLAKQAGDLFISLEALEEILFQIEGEGESNTGLEISLENLRC